MKKINPRRPKQKYVQRPGINIVLQQNIQFDEHNIKYKPIGISFIKLNFENTELQRNQILEKLLFFTKQNIKTSHFTKYINENTVQHDFEEYLNNITFESYTKQKSSWKLDFDQMKNDLKNNQQMYTFNDKVEKIHLFTDEFINRIIEKEVFDSTLYFVKKCVRYEWLESFTTNRNDQDIHIDHLFHMNKLQTYYMQMLLLGFRNKNTPQYPFVSMLHDNLKNNIESVANDIKYIVNNNNNNVYQFTQIIKNKKMALESNDRLYLSDDLFDWNRVFKNHFHEYNIITTNTNYATEPPLKLYNDAIHRLINIHNHKHTGMNTDMNTDMNTLYVIITSRGLYLSAVMVEEHLKTLRLKTTIWTQIKQHQPHYFYIIIHAPSTFVPSTSYIFWQIEQTDMTSRCTDKFSHRYMNQMNCATMIWEISPDNIDFYKNAIQYRKLNHCFMPFYDTYKMNLDNHRKYDLVFVGAMNTKRAKVLEYVKTKMSDYQILIIKNMFNDERDQLLQQSKYVFNIHYYDNSVLEIERFNHAIHCGCLILSENVKHDFHMKQYYDYFVRYFDTKNLDEVIECLRYNLQDHVYSENLKHFYSEKEKLQSLSKFYIHKNLLAADIHLPQYIDFEIQKDILLLTLVEDYHRFHIFSKQPYLPEYQLFPAFKYNIGFTGCAMSYVTIAYNCIRQKKKTIMIIEDDAILCSNFLSRMNIVHEFLTYETEGNWDVVNGYVCQIETSKDIIGYYEYKGQIFLKLKKMVGTVCNLYNKRALERLVDFSFEIAKTNQSSEYHIDRFLNFDGIEIIVPYPFLADIQPVNSTICNTNHLIAYKWFKNEEKKTIHIIEQFIKETPPLDILLNN